MLRFLFPLLVLLLGFPVVLFSSDWSFDPNPPQPPRQTKTEIWVGPGATFFANRGAAGANIGAYTPISSLSDLLVGLDLGFEYFASGLPSTIEQSIGVRVSPSIIYPFTETWGVIPYLGLSLGPHFLFEDFNAQTTGQSSRKATVSLETLLRPGVTIPFSQQLSFTLEPAVGFIGRDWIFAPSARAKIEL